jgi:hypothetical protein
VLTEYEYDRRAQILEVPGELAPPRCDAQSVPVGVFDVALAAGKTFLVDRDTELRGDGVDVAHVEMDEAARRRITCVLGQVEADVASRHGNEPREPGLELVLPFLPKPEPLEPLNRPRGGRDTENWDDLFVWRGGHRLTRY